MFRWVLICLLLAAAAFSGTLYVYHTQFADLPAQVPIHWGADGRADGFVPRQEILPYWLIMPGVMGLMALLIPLLPWLSPKQFEVDRSKTVYGSVMVLATALLGYLHAVILGASFEPMFPLARWFMGGFGLFFALLGLVIGKVQRNFWVSVRTPWTLANEEVWDRTHRMAADLFVAAGLVALAAGLLNLPWYVGFAGIIAAALAPVIYSLVLYKQLQRQGRV